jgi:fatty acid-binding protein DegV
VEYSTPVLNTTLYQQSLSRIKSIIEEIFLAELSPAIGIHVGLDTFVIACMHGM